MWNIYQTDSLCSQTIFDLFADNYALNKLKVKMKNEDAPIIIEKYNVLGWNHEYDYYTLYETPSLNKKIRSIKISNIQEIKRMED